LDELDMVDLAIGAQNHFGGSMPASAMDKRNLTLAMMAKALVKRAEPDCDSNSGE
jgi:hypothetical protein